MSKRIAENYDAEKLLVEKNEIKSRIKIIHNSITRMCTQPLSTVAADARARIQSYLYNHAGGNESNLSETRKAEYLRLKEDAGQKQKVLLKKLEEEKALLAELDELKARLSSLSRAASADNVLQLQTDVAEIESRITELTTAISREEDKVRQGNANSSLLDKLNRQREDLLADVALGVKVDQTAQQQIENKIAEEEQRVREAYNLACQAANAIAGLQRKIEEAQQEHTAKKEALQQAYCDFLITEVEKAGAEFSKTAERLWGQFSRVLALGEMIEKHPSADGKQIITGKCREFNIPAFMLDACSSQKKSDFLFDFKNIDISAAINSVKGDIAALGIVHLN